MTQNREYRNMTFEVRTDGDKPSFLVEGYASTFEPYKIIEIDGEDYNEQIMPNAFDEADMTDVVFRVDHEGPVFARASAGTVTLNVDEHGLHHLVAVLHVLGHHGGLELGQLLDLEAVVLQPGLAELLVEGGHDLLVLGLLYHVHEE